MLITESQLKNIINEEIEKMMLEEDLEEGFFSDARKGIGRYLSNKAAQLGGLTSADIRNQATGKESEESDQAFRAETKRGTARQKEIMSAYNKIMSGLGVAEKALVDLEDFLPREVGNKVASAADAYMRELESATEKALGYKPGSLRESKKKVNSSKELDEGFFDMFKRQPKVEKPSNWKPEAQPEMTQMDMFPTGGYGGSPSDSQIAKMAHDVILSSTMSVDEKRDKLHSLADMVKRDSSLSSRIHQAAMYVGDADLPELAKAVKLFERKMK